MKRPSFQFYPGDWLKDLELRFCSVGARGLWMDMLCLMHQGSEYGYLKVNHIPILAPKLAQIVGATLDEVNGWLKELEAVGSFSRDEDGTIFSRRLIRDEKTRAARAAGGILGGNPKLLEAKAKKAKKVNLPNNLEETPSSSSSSSPSGLSVPDGTGSALPMPERVGEAADPVPNRFPDDEPPPHPLPDHPDDYRGSPGPDDDHDHGAPPPPPPKKLAFDEGLMILAPGGGKDAVAKGRAFLIGICRRLNDDNEFLRVVRDCARDRSLDPKEFMSAAVEYRLGRRADRNGNRAVGKLPPREAYAKHTEFPDRDVPF